MIQSGAYYYELIQERRAKPQDDMISRLIETEVVEDGEARRLDDIEITGFCTMLGGAGAETVTKLVGNAVVVFADNPDQWQKLKDDRGKIPAAFEELLRYEGPSQYQIRTTTRDVTLHGNTIPAGDPVLLINGSASRDERFFPDPDRLRHRSRAKSRLQPELRLWHPQLPRRCAGADGRPDRAGNADRPDSEITRSTAPDCSGCT